MEGLYRVIRFLCLFHDRTLRIHTTIIVSKVTITDTILSHFNSPAIFENNFPKSVSLLTCRQTFEWLVHKKLDTKMLYEYIISSSQVHVHKIAVFDPQQVGTKSYEPADCNSCWHSLQNQNLHLLLSPKVVKKKLRKGENITRKEK